MMARFFSRMPARATSSPYSVCPLTYSGVSGGSRYLASSPARARPPRAITRPGDGLGEAEPVVAHEEPEGIAAGVTAEAMEDAALGIDGEGRGLLGMEGAEPLPVLAGTLEVHELADQLHDVQARADFVEELGA